MIIFSLFKSQQYLILRKTWKILKTDKRLVEVAYKIYGPKPSESKKHILILHGLLGFKRNWKSLSTSFAATHNASVIAADARNHGDSPHNSSHTYLELASDVSQLLRTLSINKASIIGHSMGGRTGMTLALQEPSKVHSLVVVDISPVPQKHTQLSSYPKLMNVMKAVNFKECETIQQAKTTASKFISESGVVEDVNWAGHKFLLTNIIKLRDNSFGWRCNLEALIDNFQEIASFPTETFGKQYSGPTLFIGGGQSDFLPHSHETAIKKLFPKSSITYIDHVGHNPHSEDPTAFLKIVNEFYSIIL